VKPTWFSTPCPNPDEIGAATSHDTSNPCHPQATAVLHKVYSCYW
jgi:hypothetical protein